ncbi:Hypothetical protein GLP15_98 [Giardia lamblia P15]|uniref:Uncharacterized protein n=1 Tax=Giardia intestinalis (strain P15) TaxID=658858 RepID=E1EX23_GIAIA|nr:Hypothetical protein GLP15_98 [Giardia lamblia P15]
MEDLSLLQTNFRVVGSTKAAAAFNSTVQSGAIKVLRLEEFVKPLHAVGPNLYSKDMVSTPSTVIVVTMLEQVRKTAKEYVCMRVTDLRGSDVILVCEKDPSANVSIKIEVYSVICLLKTNVVHFQNALYLESPENQILLLGRATNVGMCRHLSFTEGPCSNAIDVSVSVYCPAHTARVMSAPNAAGLRLYEELPFIDLAAARAHQVLKQIHFSSNLTFSGVIDHVINRQAQVELLKTDGSQGKRCSLEPTAKKHPRLSAIKPYATLKTSLQEERKNETTKAILCRTCQTAAVVAPESCTTSGHNLETIYVKVHRYKCNTCSGTYKTIRKYGPSFSCSTCFTSMWTSAYQDQLTS